MKFVKKFLILGLFALVGFSFCNAGYLGNYQRTYKNVAQTRTEFTGDIFVLFKTNTTNCWYCPTGNDCDNNTRIALGQHEGIFFTGSAYIQCSTSNSIYQYIYNGNYYSCPTCPTIDSNYCTSNNLCPSCPSCPSQYTSLECQTEYSLIPVSSVTENYCTSNFDLIFPSDCPISSGTGDTQRSALFLNNVQYAGASNIYINISEALDYSTTYIDSGSSFVFDVDGYVADTGYLNDILTVQEYHPNSEDFTTAFVSVLTLGLPYVVVALFVLLVRKLVKKIFKS